MAFDFIVLGATGMQGRIVSRDLLETGYSVFLCGWEKTGDQKNDFSFIKKIQKKNSFQVC